MKLPAPPVLDATVFVIYLVLAVVLIVMLVGCGSTTDRQTKTVERIESQTGPLIIDTPIGQITAQPIRHVMERSETEVERTDHRIDAPEVGGFISAAAGASPIGPAVGILGVLTAAATGWQAMRAKRQRDELVDGIERAKTVLDDDKRREFLLHVEAEQSADTKNAVKARVG